VWNYLNSQYVDHTFDLLGSGPINVAYNNKFLSVEGCKYSADVVTFSNYEELISALLREPHADSASLIGSLIDKDYEPIDWQVDFKSGYRWSEKTASSKIQYGDVLGADIKVPWELARLQHLPQLAIQALQNEETAQLYCREIRNQILDFIAMNPPRMGVNWVCAMDVGIRVSNMLIANELAESAVGCSVDNEYRAILSQSVYEHGVHIVDSLEYSPELTSNHYLANIVGLLFVSAYLESSVQTNQWLAFSLQEIISEVRRQYYDDGSNFEGSTSYHRLSTEMLVYAVALIKGLPQERVESLKTCPTQSWKKTPRLKDYVEQEYRVINYKVELPEWFCQRIKSAVQYSIDMTKPDGSICQIGDNDSGRFFKFTSIGSFLTKEEALSKYRNLSDGGALNYKNDSYWDDDCLNHSAYISAASAIFNIELPEYITNCELERSIVLSLSKGSLIDVKAPLAKGVETQGILAPIDAVVRKSIEISFRSEVDAGESLLNGLQQYWYPDSQVLVFRSSKLYLSLYSVPNGSNGNGVHSHNDQLSIEVMINGHDVCKDPGAYLYTSNPDRRNQFRSVNVHNTLRTGVEPNGFFGSANALFAKQNNTKCCFSKISQFSAVMDMAYGNTVQRRSVKLTDSKIVIDDQCNDDFDNTLNPFGYFSNGYGQLMEVSLGISNIDIVYKD